MKRFLKFSLLCFCLLLITGCGNKYMKEVSYKEYHKLLDNKETFVLEIMRTDCSACQSFKPKLTEVLNKYKIEVKYINTDHLSEKDLKKLYNETGIDGTPTVIFYTKGEEETKATRINGSVSVDKIISKFKAVGLIK